MVKSDWVQLARSWHAAGCFYHWTLLQLVIKIWRFNRASWASWFNLLRIQIWFVDVERAAGFAASIAPTSTTMQSIL
jgi:hypothetical protein